MAQVVTFGEAMIRLSPPDFKRLEQATTLDVPVGGSELTVAASVSRLGLTSRWVTRLPNSPLGRMAQNKAREFGVDTSYIVWTTQDRMGLYFIEYGASPRENGVLYDRSFSAMSQIAPGQVDWAQALQGAQWFHASGITPALSPSAASATEEALRTAKQMGCTVSYDLNYRPQLCSPEQARAGQEKLLRYVDVLIMSQGNAKRVFEIETEDSQEAARQLAQRFDLDAVTITLRTAPSLRHNTWSAIAYSSGKFYKDVIYDVEIVDRIGGGDNYTAGFICGYLTEGIEKGVCLGNAFAVLKQTSWSDFNWATREEAEALLEQTKRDRHPNGGSA